MKSITHDSYAFYATRYPRRKRRIGDSTEQKTTNRSRDLCICAIWPAVAGRLAWGLSGGRWSVPTRGSRPICDPILIPCSLVEVDVLELGLKL